MTSDFPDGFERTILNRRPRRVDADRYSAAMTGLADAVDAVAAETGFSGVVRVDRDGAVEFAAAYGLAHRGWGIPNTVDVRFAVASGSKTLTALAVVSLIEDGVLELTTTARSVLGAGPPADRRGRHGRAPAVAPIGHRRLPRRGRARLDRTTTCWRCRCTSWRPPSSSSPCSTGTRAVSAPGERFAYCNGGYVVLALIAERASGTAFHDLVEQRVCAPAGMVDTAFLRSDELPGGVALGYLAPEPALRTNVLHLPVRGNGDGGAYTTAADVHALVGRLRRRAHRRRTVGRRDAARPRATAARLGGVRARLLVAGRRRGLQLEGMDAGCSFRSVHRTSPAVTYTVLANTTDGAWPVLRAIASHV